MKAETKQRLMGVSTATLCTALFKQGLRNQFIQDVHPLHAAGPNMVGEAYTLRYIPAREMTVFEDFVAEKVKEGRSILGLYPPTDERSRIDFAAWRKAQGR